MLTPNVPGGQGRQLDCKKEPVILDHVPARHALHVVELGCSVYEPAGHAAQLVAPTAGHVLEKVPALQDTQVAAFVAVRV